MDPDGSLSSLFSAIEVMPLSLVIYIAIAISILLLFLSAFMSGSEVAFFSLSPQEVEEIKEQKHTNDHTLEHLLRDSEHLLGTILIGNNLVNVAIVMLTTYIFQSVFDFSAAPMMGFLFQVIGLTFLLLLFGEILPKIYCQQRALQIARSSAPVMAVFKKIFYPLSKFLVYLGSIVGKGIGYKKYELSPEELNKAIQLTTDAEEEKGLLTEIVKFYSTTVSHVMTPRMDMVSLPYNTPYDEVLSFVKENGYSRIPVYEERIDNVRGILYIKDLLPHLSEPATFEWQKIIREAFFVPETKKIDDLLEEFRRQRMHMAIVVDEFGGTCGLVTLEDLLEEVLGEISDEYDEESKPYKILNDGSIIFDAKISLTDFLKVTKITDPDILEQGEEVDTLGGLILEAKGDFPVKGETISVPPYNFMILEMGRRRISKVKFFQDPDAE
ncbi:gliding motility-associated protein GldE [Porphyromonas sp. COT-108 OH1349]|uniref:gliding motility-associated protein GldE n=1 Tax=Porphyromonas sp. COT-108 OH1349 TaxID=1537504 RepID=UPI00052DF3E3|nr:hemolysin [Porphyromonas sp. COT-108 OH1349]